jgi:hypothetical protein
MPTHWLTLDQTHGGSDVLDESDLVLALGWLTSYHDVCLKEPSEGKIDKVTERDNI